jgi:hypothetical protein
MATRAAADLDGDGLADMIIVNKMDANWHVGGPFLGMFALPNRGDGRFGVPDRAGNLYGVHITPGTSGNSAAPQTDALSSDTMTQSALRFGDLNGDGFTDFAVLDSNGLSICIRYGGWNDIAHWQCVTDSHLAGADQSNADLAKPTIMIGDVSGSGIQQVIYFPAPANPFGAPQGAATAVLVSPNGSTSDGPRDGLLQTVANGLGAQTSYSYDSLYHLNRANELALKPSIGRLPTATWVVTEATTTNGLDGGNAISIDTRYSYNAPI